MTGTDYEHPNGPIRLLIFGESMRGRGTERTIARLLNHFDRTRVQPELALVAAEGAFLTDVPPDVVLHDLELKGKRPYRAYWRLRKLIDLRRPDLLMGVHTAPSRLAGLLRLVAPHLKVVAYETDLFSKVEASKGNAGFRRLATSASHRLAHRVIASSDSVAQDLKDCLGISPPRVVLIPNPCVDDALLLAARESFTHPAFDSKGTRQVIVNIGNMYEHKRQDLLIEAFARVIGKTPANLVLFGDGPLRERLEQMCLELKISDHVWFMGFHRNPFKFLSKAAVFVSSSSAEGFDVSQVEAMACGTPVIVTDVPRHRIVEHGETGLLVRPNDPDALAAAIQEILESSELAQRLSSNARPLAMDLSAENIARRYEALFASVLNKK